MKHIRREITPISEQDFYVLQNHFNAQFDYPIHYHPEYELNLVFNTKGKRIIGDSIKNYEDFDLVLVGSNIMHAWTSDFLNNDARVVTIQFAKDFLSKQTLSRNVMSSIKTLLAKSQQGVVFNDPDKSLFKNKILKLADIEGFNGVLEFLSLLNDMSIATYSLILPHTSTLNDSETIYNNRILEVCYFIQKNFKNKIVVNDVAELINMTPSAFSHFFKKRTYRSFTDYVIDLRISNACHMLIETDESIANISDNNGFNNLSNFNKLFKSRKNMTPKDFRKIIHQVEMNKI
ncbi:MAG: AraC family transcriptional regulator [Salinivirgaceae bacterium]